MPEQKEVSTMTTTLKDQSTNTMQPMSLQDMEEEERPQTAKKKLKKAEKKLQKEKQKQERREKRERKEQKKREKNERKERERRDNENLLQSSLSIMTWLTENLHQQHTQSSSKYLLTWLREETQLKKMVLITVFNAFFLDHMLLSVVVPILPSILYTQEQVTILPGNSTDSTGRAPLINTSGVASSTFAPALHRPLHSDHHFTPTQKSSGSNCSEAGLQPDAVNIKVGLLLASKSTVQLIFNPFTGPLTDRVGYHILICAGFCIIFLSATLFAFSSTYILLLLARSLQGVGGSCLSVAGMSMLADVFTDDEQRGRAMRVSFTGLALALIVGAPFGSVMYQFVGKMAPFLVLAVLTGLCGDSVSYLIAANVFGYLSQKYSVRYIM
ncbi:synaptic vesicular amine transporter-like [Parambassis ranga]|uniref:Synaptic vesicular amine transporter-like n=1 Tax=Parambassis ranga TaxID=210632 RepID=A0A6P7IR26_9TELE|nr:synaptic vesicular amine transporter-like [Parambassis ranga]